MTFFLPDCRSYEDDLKAYADGELPPLRRFAVRRHLTHCASCREEISAMTQLTEDLRAAEADAPLRSELREKLLAVPGTKEPTPARSSPPLPKWEGEEVLANDLSESPRPLASGGPLRSNLLRSKEVGSRKPRALAWGLAGAALIAWFVMFPIFQRNSLEASHMNRTMQEAQSNAFKRPLPPDTGKKVVYNGFGLEGRVTGPVDGNIQTFDASGNSLNSTRKRILRSMTYSSNAIAPDAPQRQVHKEATLGVQVPNPETTSDTVATMVTETGGYVASNTLDTGNDGLKTAELVVKVPVTQFDTFLRQVAKLGSVQSKNITGEDITEQTSDADQTESVLENDVQQAQARLNALGSRAKWRDEQAARDLRIQLAQSQARLVLLKRMAALSTVTIDLSQTPKAAVVPPVTGGFLTGLKDTTHDALQSLLSSGGALLALVIWLVAYAPLWIPMLLVGRYALKEYRKRQAV